MIYAFIIIKRKLLKEIYSRLLSITLGAFSTITIFFSPIQDMMIDSVCRKVAFIIALLLFPLIISIIVIHIYKTKKVIDEANRKIVIKYDDILKIGFPSKIHFIQRKKKKIVVINVNTAFDTIVDTDLANIKKPLVSENTIHGKWIKEMESKGINAEKINDLIDKNLKLMGERPLHINKKNRGNINEYSIGTICQVEYENTIFYLLAISTFNENNNAISSRKDLEMCIEKLIDYYDKHGNQYDLYIPLMGSGLSRANIDDESSLEMILYELKQNKEKLHNLSTIVVYTKLRGKLAISNY